MTARATAAHAREPVISVEAEHDLRRVGPGDRTASLRPTRAETEKSIRLGAGDPPRTILRKKVAAAAASSADEAEFFSALAADNVQVRLRYASADPQQVVGYAVTIPEATAADGTPIWYGGGKLAPDLTLPKLRHRWADPRQLDHSKANAPADLADRAIRDATRELRRVLESGAAGAADGAWAAADLLRGAHRALGRPELMAAAEHYERASREPYGRIPPRSRIGIRLRWAARIIAHTTGDYDMAGLLALMGRLVQLLEVIADLRQLQSRPHTGNRRPISSQRRTAGVAPRPDGDRGRGSARTNSSSACPVRLSAATHKGACPAKSLAEAPAIARTIEISSRALSGAGHRPPAPGRRGGAGSG